jgi:type VI secretion system secreted protein VgrG
MQPHGGDIEGFHFPLRKATEVVFSFLGGDPDRPVISGVVPNAIKPSPVTLANYTKNVIQTGSYNRVEMEDLSGGQWIHLSTPASATHLFMGTIGECDHNIVLETQGTGHIHTHGLLDVNVEGVMNETVVGDVTELYDSNVSQTILGHKTTLVITGQTETVLAGFTQTILAFSKRLIVGPYTQAHLGEHTQTHLGAHVHVHLGEHTHTHLGEHTHTQIGELTRTRLGATTEVLIGNVDRNVTGDVAETVSGDVKWEIGGKVEIKSAEWDVDTGPIEIKASGPHASFLFDISSEMVAGIKSEVFVGAKNDMTFGLTNETKIAAYLENTAGPHIHDKTEKVVDAICHAANVVTHMENSSLKTKEHALYSSIAALHSLDG